MSPEDPFHFVRAVEGAWNQFALRRADAELAANGHLRWPIGDKEHLLVGPGFIEFHFPGRVDRCEAKDIKSIGVNNRQFHIVHRDAKWFSMKGRYSFSCGTMP